MLTIRYLVLRKSKVTTQHSIHIFFSFSLSEDFFSLFGPLFSLNSFFCTHHPSSSSSGHGVWIIGSRKLWLQRVWFRFRRHPLLLRWLRQSRFQFQRQSHGSGNCSQFNYGIFTHVPFVSIRALTRTFMVSEGKFRIWVSSRPFGVKVIRVLGSYHF